MAKNWDCASGMPCATLLGVSNQQFNESQESYLRDLKFSPDGKHLLSNSNDNILRVYEPVNDLIVEDVLPELCLNMCYPVYDTCWHPNSQSFTTSARRTSVLLWSSNDGTNLCSFPIKNHVDEVTGPFSLQFDLDGNHLFCGFDKCIRIIDLNRPNDFPVVRSLKNQVSIFSQSGIISSIAITSQLYALSSYAGVVGLYDLKSGASVGTLINGHDSNGITSVKFSKDENLLISAARKDQKICVWDLRQISIPLITFLSRNAKTNQKIAFDLLDNYLISGSLEGRLLVYDLTKLDRSPWVVPAHDDCSNSVSCNPRQPGILASGSGQRHYLRTVMNCEDSDESSGEDSHTKYIENCIKFWKLDLT